MKRSAYDDCRTDIKNASLSDEQKERVSYTLNIHAALKLIFDKSENLYDFMPMNNHNAFFDGCKLIDIIASGRLDNLSNTFKRIDSLITR